MTIINKEDLHKIINDDWLLMDDCEGNENCDVVKDLARMALAGMEAEPVGVTDKSEIECLKRGEMANVMPPDYKGCDVGDSVCLCVAPQPLTTSERAELENCRNAQQVVPEWTNEQCLEFLSIAFRHAEIKGDLEMDDIRLGVKMVNACRAAMQSGAVKDGQRNSVRNEHAEWSQSTFGSVGPVGPLKHLSKEALEAAAEPGDLSEWADMQFLLWDAQRRAGITDQQITQAMIEKLAVNKARNWPEPKDGEPRLHIKSAPQQERSNG